MVSEILLVGSSVLSNWGILGGYLDLSLWEIFCVYLFDMVFTNLDIL